HQTGFAVDLAKYSDTIDFIRPSFPYAGICGHFRDICAQYGFIERYPAGREHITSIAHEPWHFRYVGYPHSEVMKRNDLTLEEYTDYLKQFSYQRNHLRLEVNWHNYEIFYVPIQNESEKESESKTETVIEIPNGIPFQVSGNNVDGVVVTLWRD
ncbi:MAG TPA: D-alanyl-D-alanine carboxypeptidase family protein, partial [Treponemataceae bacterium]|nr:D-alanyl-D-alanine carboxypeptidase family protein [Treponemataceae bacterium]